MKSQYPLMSTSSQLRQIILWIQEVVRLRQVEDLPDFTNLTDVFVSGRTTTRVPSSSADVIGDDTLGDTCYALDASFMYVLVDKSGTLTWCRVALDSTW